VHLVPAFDDGSGTKPAHGSAPSPQPRPRPTARGRHGSAPAPAKTGTTCSLSRDPTLSGRPLWPENKGVLSGAGKRPVFPEKQGDPFTDVAGPSPESIRDPPVDVTGVRYLLIHRHSRGRQCPRIFKKNPVEPITGSYNRKNFPVVHNRIPILKKQSRS